MEEAECRFGELVERALADGPQTVRRTGKAAVVVVSESEFRKTARPAKTLFALLRECPEDLREIVPQRSKEPARNTGFES